MFSLQVVSCVFSSIKYFVIFLRLVAYNVPNKGALRCAEPKMEEIFIWKREIF